MPQKKPGSPHKASNTSPAKKAQQPILQFPSVSTRLSSYQAKSDYDSLGLPFKATKRNGTMDLQTFFGAGPIQQIVASGQIIFHLMGDSGVGTAEQEAVADAMASDINNVNHELGPSFMVHLGDVIYGPNKQATYADRFYRKYDSYDRLIFAIPGNHDGEVFPSTDPKTLAAFTTNFCAASGKQPPLAKQFGMLMPNQPGPYWHLTAPFVDIIGLYSNADENVGIIGNANVGAKQKTWLQSRLKAIAAAGSGGERKGLVIAVHHPPYARGFQTSGVGHPSNPEMTQDIDDCCAQAGILPDAVIAGHTHSYQHYVRTQNFKGATHTIPYLIVGTGGIGLQRLPAPTGVRNSTGDVLYYSAFKDYGYLMVTASATQLTMQFYAVVATHRELWEQIVVNLAMQTIV
ncbi:MAG TPA: metallophosphoesterase [Humisphaera sp.]|nr:metallophosphoesterase [Humisphaera sp.]